MTTPTIIPNNTQNVTNSKPTKPSKNKKVIILVSVGVATLALTVLGIIWSINLLTSQYDDAQSEWEKIGRVSFSNEYGVISLEDSEMDPIVDKLWHDKGYYYIEGESFSNSLEKSKIKAKTASQIRLSYFDMKNFNEEFPVYLYAKSNSVNVVYKIKDERSGNEWPVQLGDFTTEAGEQFNARILLTYDSYSTYLYFNI